jgi:DNA-binding transcriptional LysR family regulator
LTEGPEKLGQIAERDVARGLVCPLRRDQVGNRRGHRRALVGEHPDVALGGAEHERLGQSVTSQGLGERLDRTLEELGKTAPGLQVRLVSAPAAERIAQVRAGELDAAFVRAVTAAPGIELLPTWQDPPTVPCPRPIPSPPSRPSS